MVNFKSFKDFMLVHVFTIIMIINIFESSNEAVQIKCSLLNVLITASFFTFIRDFFFFRKVLSHLLHLRGLDCHGHFVPPLEEELFIKIQENSQN